MAVIVPGESAMLKSLGRGGGGEVAVDPEPQPTRLPIHSQIHRVTNARAGVSGRRYTRIVRFPKLNERSIRRAKMAQPTILPRDARKYNT